jgi:cation transport ATPase
MEKRQPSIPSSGTLTLSKPEVAELDAAPGVSPTELLRVAASAQAWSEHPLARAIERKGRRGWYSPRRGNSPIIRARG